MNDKNSNKELNIFVNGMIKKLLISGGVIAIITHIAGYTLNALGFLAGVVIASINFRLMAGNAIMDKFKNLKNAAVKNFFLRYVLIFAVTALFAAVNKVSVLAVLCGLLTLPVFLVFAYGFKGKYKTKGKEN